MHQQSTSRSQLASRALAVWIQIGTEMFLPSWLMTGFVHVLPLPTAFRIFDCFVLEGPSFLLRAALGLLKVTHRCSRHHSLPVVPCHAHSDLLVHLPLPTLQYYEPDLLGGEGDNCIQFLLRLRTQTRAIDEERLFDLIWRMEINQKKFDSFLGS